MCSADTHTHTYTHTYTNTYTHTHRLEHRVWVFHELHKFWAKVALKQPMDLFTFCLSV